MRSSDPSEGPVFLWLKLIIIIISQPGSGCDLYDEHWKVCVCVCGGGQWLRMLNLKRFRQCFTTVTMSLLHFSFSSDFALQLYAVCTPSAFEVKTWVTECHLSSNSTCLAEGSPSAVVWMGNPLIWSWTLEAPCQILSTCCSSTGSQQHV